MPRLISSTELDIIEEIIGRYSNGIKIDELLKTPELKLPRRTLQRRLNVLIDQGRLIVDVRGAGSKYNISPHKPVPYGDFQIPLSHISRSIQQYVNQPLSGRKSVNYNQNFLDEYRPNETFYLPLPTREYLKKIGDRSAEMQTGNTYIKKIFHRLLIDLSWNSSRLEGNTYSLLETERLLELGKQSEDKSMMDAQMILNHKEAINFLVESADDITYNRATILNLHALLSDNLLSNPAASGRLRNISVNIAKTVFTPLNITQLVAEFFKKILDMACEIQDPFEQSFFVMVHLPYLQPFEDVNKRVSRLAANISFIQTDLSPLSFINVPQKAYVDGLLGVYELNQVDLLRDIFVWAYQQSAERYTTTRQELGEPDPLKFKYREQIREVIREVVNKCLDVKDTMHYVQSWIENNIPDADRARFREVTEIELLNLHDGNIARFRLSIDAFKKWVEMPDWNRIRSSMERAKK